MRGIPTQRTLRSKRFSAIRVLAVPNLETAYFVRGSSTPEFSIQTGQRRRTAAAGDDRANPDLASIDELDVDFRVGERPKHLFADTRVGPQADSHDRQFGHVRIEAQVGP